MAEITEADRKLMAEVKADPAAYWWLQQKARWEGETLYRVLLEWGDPRKWPGYPWTKLRGSSR